MQVAADGGTTRLGALLAPMAVQYVVVPLAPAPDPYARDTTYLPSNLLAVLDGQLDLDSVTVNTGVRVYQNSAYGPSRALLPPDTVVSDGGDRLADRRIPGLAQAPPVLTDTQGYSDWSGPVDEPGQLFVSAASDGWVLEVDGEKVQGSSALGWANTFPVASSGSATLRFDTPVARWLALAGQVLVWALALAYLALVRVREDEGTALDLSPGGPEPKPEAPRHVVVEPDLFERALGSGGAEDRPTQAVPVVGMGSDDATELGVGHPAPGPSDPSTSTATPPDGNGDGRPSRLPRRRPR